MQPYDLRCELDPPHQGDVKAVLAISNDIIASASRDSSVGVWTRSGNSGLSLKALFNGHHAYVNSLAHIPSNDNTDDLLASGGNSSMILLHSLKTFSPESQHCLVGHSLNVCALQFSAKHQRLISGSWDQTARVWKTSAQEWETEVVLQGHDQAVWGVSSIDEGPKTGCYLTGSADRMIILWSGNGEMLQRYKGSPEPVRSLTILPGGNTFASACNDNLIRLWDFEGAVTKRLRGHRDYVYQVVNEKNVLVSCGEDHTARVWDDGEEIAKLLHPCQTVWSVSCLPNGDIVTGGSDGRVRIWTTAVDRLAAQDIREAYIQTVKEEMPTSKPETNETTQGATLTIDIDLSDDDPPIPLVYQIGSDPRTTAEAFGQEHGLSDNYINQIEAFIKAHLEAAGL